MKFLSILLAALVLPVSAALAQTVLPSGAVAPTGVLAPSGAIVTPGAAPGGQPLSTIDARNSGSPRAARHDEKVPGMSHQDRKQMRKMGKVRYNSDAEKQTEKK